MEKKLVYDHELAKAQNALADLEKAYAEQRKPIDPFQLRHQLEWLRSQVTVLRSTVAKLVTVVHVLAPNQNIPFSEDEEIPF